VNPKDFPILGKIENLLTRMFLCEPVRRTALGRRLYKRMYLFGKGLAEKQEVQLFRRHLRPGMTIVDMGANIGFYTVLFSTLVGERGAVYAFEPDPFCSGILRDRIRVLPIQNVHVETAALGEGECKATLYCSKRDRAENRVYPFDSSVPVETVQVPMLGLDMYCSNNRIDRIDAVKIDVEGLEVSALRGMRDIMGKSPPAWMFIEFSPVQLRGAGASSEAFWQVLAGDGYICYFLNDQGQLRKISDTPAFTKAHARSESNIWAVHHTQPQPASG
jgi:FkbM family methyltransferase